jgi:hypothetical protein
MLCSDTLNPHRKHREADQPEAGMPLGYRSIFTVAGDQSATDVAAGQFRSWLRHKRLDADATTPGLHEVGDQARLVVTEMQLQDGSHALRYRLTESRPDEEWVTTLTARADGRGPGWVWVDVTAPAVTSTGVSAGGDQELPADQGPRWTAVPVLVRNILGVTSASDGRLDLADRPETIGRDKLDDLIEVICDPERRGAAIVAAPSPGYPTALLREEVAELTRHCVGLAGSYVLDEEVAAELDRSFGSLHAVPAGALRTYLPGADPASSVDARRHRIMLARTIAAGPVGKLAHTLGWASRARAVGLALPSQVARVDRLLSREEPGAVLRSIQQPRPAASADAATVRHVAIADTRWVIDEATQIAVDAASEAATADREIARAAEAVHAPVEEAAAAAAHDVALTLAPLAALLKEFAVDSSMESRALGAEEILSRLRELIVEGRHALRGQAELSRTVTELQDSLDHLEDLRAEASTRLEEEQLDHAATREDLLRARFQADQLRGALAALQAPAHVWVTTSEPPALPASFEELLSRLEDCALPGVSFTGDPSHALELDHLDPFGTWAGKTWEMLRALDGYTRLRCAGKFANGLHAYLTQTPPGQPGYSARAHAAQESDSVLNSPRLKSLRVLPVPAEVSPAEKAFMGAHFKIAKSGTVSPRMHYLDDSAHTGKVYVGYIGRHLANTLTN